jgi:DNA-binding CsgD family transcriptional regulator
MRLSSEPIYARAFVGRSEEMGVLEARFRNALDAAGSVTLVSGEAGAGKSRLVTEARTQFVHLIAVSAVGQCLEFARSPYGPFCELLQTLLAVFEPAAPPAPHLRTALRALVPTLHVARAESTTNEDLQKRWMFEAVRETLLRFSAKHPALLVLEDLHWADAGSLDLLRFVAPALVDTRICVLGTYRSEGIDRRHPMHATLGEMERAHTTLRMELPLLDDVASLALIDSALPGRAPLAADVRRRICTLGEGNPLFLEELVKSAVELPDGAALELPRSLEHAVHGHLAGLSDDQVAIVETAAVVGRRFGAADLQRLSGADAPATVAALRAACDANVLRADPRRFDGFQFRHELTRQIIYRNAAPDRLRSVHRTIAGTLESSSTDDASATELAYRWREAGEPVRAGHFAEIAGDYAYGIHAYADAAELFESASATQGLSDGAAARIHDKAARSLYFLGDLTNAERHQRLAAERFTACGKTGGLVRSHLHLASIALRRASVADAIASCRTAIDLARPLYPSNTVLSQALLNLSEYAVMSGDTALASESLDAADALGRARPPDEEVIYRHVRGVVAFLTGDLATWRTAAEGAVAVAPLLEDPEKYVTACYNLASLAAEIGEWPLALEYFEKALREGDNHSLLAITCYARLAYADASFEHGSVVDASEAVYAVLRSGVNSPMVRIAVATAGIPIALATGDDGLLARCDLRETIDVAAASGESARFGPLAAAYAQLFIAGDDVPEAQRLLARALEMMTDLWSNLPTLVLVARICSGDEIERARRILTASLAARPHDRARAYGELFEAYACRAAGDAVGVRRHALAAALLLERCEARRPLAEAHELLGEAQAALGLYREMGATADVTRIESPGAAKPARPVLTRREAEIARQAVDGRSNREIAEMFSLSERTVEHHIASIYRKLGVRTRLQLAKLLAG